MENQHRQIKGYRELTQTEIDLMNEIKAQGEVLGELIARISCVPGVDPRCVAVSKTKMQEGCMWLVRSITRPESFA